MILRDSIDLCVSGDGPSLLDGVAADSSDTSLEVIDLLPVCSDAVDEVLYEWRVGLDELRGDMDSGLFPDISPGTLAAIRHRARTLRALSDI